MNEPKAFASLSSGLLARKGAAKPAMRPQGFGHSGVSLEDLGWDDMGFEPPKPSVAATRDEDHDAFGDAVTEQPLRNPIAALTPSPVHGQQNDLAQQFGAEFDEDEDAEEPEGDDDAAPEQPVLKIAKAPALVAPVPVAAAPVLTIAPRAAAERIAAPRSAHGSGAKTAFTLRLDSARHLRLRLACVISGRSAQRLVTEALDAHLTTFTELEDFAGQLPGTAKSSQAKG